MATVFWLFPPNFFVSYLIINLNSYNHFLLMLSDTINYNWYFEKHNKKNCSKSFEKKFFSKKSNKRGKMKYTVGWGKWAQNEQKRKRRLNHCEFLANLQKLNLSKLCTVSMFSWKKCSLYATFNKRTLKYRKVTGKRSLIILTLLKVPRRIKKWIWSQLLKLTSDRIYGIICV